MYTYTDVVLFTPARVAGYFLQNCWNIIYACLRWSFGRRAGIGDNFNVIFRSVPKFSSRIRGLRGNGRTVELIRVMTDGTMNDEEEAELLAKEVFYDRY